MEIEYKVFQTRIGELEATLNQFAEAGWSLHTVLDWDEGRVVLILEGARAPVQETPEPMRMKGYVNT